jgi:tRNA 2-selenouridine synthase
MPIHTITATQAATSLGDFDTVIDARSPAEFADDHLPGAVNWPSLDDDERVVVGTEYKQVSAFDARKQGAALIARRIAEHIDAHVLDKPKSWRPLVYCWRGGKRSGTLAWFLDQIGFRTSLVEGGYKAFRTAVREQLDLLPLAMNFTVIAGKTGSGKTRLLQALRDEGAQVLNLEGLAKHRGSLLGGLPGDPQPSQKAFETDVWNALRAFDPAQPIFVESESRKIGARHIPDALLERMRKHGQCVVITLPNDARVRLLLDEYAFYTRDAALFCQHIGGLVELRGHDVIARWHAQAHAGQWGPLFADLMASHYDPLYLRSMGRNYDVSGARSLAVASETRSSYRDAAQALLLGMAQPVEAPTVVALEKT